MDIQPLRKIEILSALVKRELRARGVEDHGDLVAVLEPELAKLYELNKQSRLNPH